jgi:alpha-amylase
MCTKYFADGDVHKYFNPYGSPFDAFINYMNVLTDFESRVRAHTSRMHSVPAPARRTRRPAIGSALQKFPFE